MTDLNQATTDALDAYAEDLTARARKGAALLDAWAARTGYGLPVGDWAGQVDTDRLDLATDDDCVLGQVFGGYMRGKHELFGDVFDGEFEAAILHGFDLRPEELLIDDMYGRASWAVLTGAWLGLIAERTEEISDPRSARD